MRTSLPRTFEGISCGPLTITECSFEAENRVLTMVIAGYRRKIKLFSGSTMSLGLLTNSSLGGFFEIEHPIKDDLLRGADSVVRSTVIEALNPHGISIISYT